MGATALKREDGVTEDAGARPVRVSWRAIATLHVAVEAWISEVAADAASSARRARPPRVTILAEDLRVAEARRNPGLEAVSLDEISGRDRGLQDELRRDADLVNILRRLSTSAIQGLLFRGGVHRVGRSAKSGDAILQARSAIFHVTRRILRRAELHVRARRQRPGMRVMREDDMKRALRASPPVGLGVTVFGVPPLCRGLTVEPSSRPAHPAVEESAEGMPAMDEGSGTGCINDVDVD